MANFTDDFNRANNADLGTSWTPVTGSVAWSVSGNAAQADAGGSRCAEYVNSFTPANDQYAQAALGTVDTAPGADQPPGGGPAVRVATAANTYYGALANSLATSEIELVKVVAGTLTSLGTYTAGAAPVTGDTIRIEATGTTIRVLHNSTVRISVSDSSISSGQVGVNGLAWNNVPTLDNFDGGDLSAASTPVGFAGTKRQPGAPGPRDRRGFLKARVWDYTITVPSFPAQYFGLKAFFQGSIQDLCLVDVGNAQAGMGGVIRIVKGGVTYDVYLVDTTDPNASPIRIQTSTGVKAIRKKT
jgi:hypothetical protein